MADYNKVTDFEVKDGLSTGDPEKIVSGAELEAEFDAIAAAIRSKVGSSFSMISALQTEEVAQVLHDLLFEVGMIKAWYGSTLDIPSGWALCNGTNGTPDLRNRFIVGAGSTYALNATGGATTDTATSAASEGTTGSTTLTVDQIPEHRHAPLMAVAGEGTYRGLSANTAASDHEYNDNLQPEGDLPLSQDVGGGAGHTHPAGDHTHSVTVDTLPPYYGLYYIMYTGFNTEAGIGNTDEPLPLGQPVILQLACSDLTTSLSTGTSTAYVRAPRAFDIETVRASLLTESSSGAVTVDINKNGTTVLTTKLTIDANEKTSVSAATPAVISPVAVADDDILTVDIDGAGTGAKGLIVTIIGTSA